MKIIFMEQEIELMAPTVDDVIQHIQILLGKEYYYSHIKLEEDTIYEGLEEVLRLKMDSITQFEVIGITATVFTADLIITAQHYIQSALPQIQGVITNFYNQDSSEHWSDLNDLLGSLQWMFTMNDAVSSSIACPKEWHIMQIPFTKIQNVLQEFLEALENQDQVLIADMLNYEIQPILEEMNEKLMMIIGEERLEDVIH